MGNGDVYIPRVNTAATQHWKSEYGKRPWTEDTLITLYFIPVATGRFCSIPARSVMAMAVAITHSQRLRPMPLMVAYIRGDHSSGAWFV